MEEVWREIVSGEKETKELPDNMMTLEDFLTKAGVVDDQDVKMEEGSSPPMMKLLSKGMYAFDAVPHSSYQVMVYVEGSIDGFGIGMEVISGSDGVRGKRAHEMVHEIDRKIKGGNVMFKIDMSKAYDRLEWGFLLKVLERFGFSNQWRDLIFRCISSYWFLVSLSGKSFGFLNPREVSAKGIPSLLAFSFYPKTP
ncbi:RVT_1 domain-containing protein [Cephalotus follicularis]|uniref:RVT_1 domain-containing protein n=1 Tax=Cephalotus follicularis TaxID=3775 RepID=A0A1Q3CNS3_CEPFO|nr:RVT_1 domain-containing protein [Cephalotus follicularis]